LFEKGFVSFKEDYINIAGSESTFQLHNIPDILTGLTNSLRRAIPVFLLCMTITAAVVVVFFI